jgi:hypothetical protein
MRLDKKALRSKIAKLKTHLRHHNKDVSVINLIIHAQDGYLYELTSRYSQPQSSAAQIYRTDASLVQSLIARLSIEPESWLRILACINQRPTAMYSYHAAEVHQEVATTVMRGDLILYRLPLLDAATSLRGNNNMGLCIIKGPKPHCATHLSPAPIDSTQHAQALLMELGIETSAVLGYLNNHNLHNSYDQSKPLDEVLNRLAKKELLAYKIPLPPMSVPGKTIEFVAAVGPRYEPVTLGPESPAKSSDTTLPFKRKHLDGHTLDPYTLQTDSKPLGAKDGVMPKECLGLKLPPKNHNTLVEQGYPNLHFERAPGEFNLDFANFSEARADVLPPGTTLYRILDEQANPAGCYWATQLPANKACWRGDYAVKDSWNDNGYYTDYTVPPGDGLKVWRGTTAGQEYREHNGKEFYLEGGNEQIFISPNTVSPTPKKFTPWTDASS